ncbi:carbon-nitrogen hydrolase family protein [Marilutibacter aestuarii]|uniref:Carbon-nitrogen hydrolase family protein n=1 Tax=Marilutibacter aestuarii TaxID=1706195 RepID=A0A508ACM2_9GAMM|nr:carbon-nitrogen hydrolase family protein [Lysobacter aestuarii]TQD47690.1 carbon-nitrogen hydrolase family protein [Lysobacter aestuarii]
MVAGVDARGPWRVAAAKYRVVPRATGFDFQAFARKQGEWLGEAREQGAQWVVLPEYLSLELAAIHPPAVHADLRASLDALQSHHEAWLALYSSLAKATGMHVTAGSFLLRIADGRWRNRSYHFSPDGGHGWQDKLQLTGFEKQAGVIAPGDALRVFDAGPARFGISICYDSEFPLPVRAQCEAGAGVIAVPSCTDTEAGATRVRVGCMARALENRCFVVQSVTSGEAPWSPALDTNTGEAAIFAPMDAGLPADGVLACTRGDERWAIADLDFAALQASRARAQVANDLDWPGQSRPGLLRARLSALDD